MAITSKMLWQQALRSGTIIGLVDVAFALLSRSVGTLEGRFWSTLVSVLSFAVFVVLIYAFTRRVAVRASAREGFDYARCMGFVMRMMLFAGFILGVYVFLMNKFIQPEVVRESLSQTVMAWESMFPQGVDQAYAMAETMVFNPIYIIIASILGMEFYGLLVGLLTSALARRKPDIFAPAEGETPASHDE